MLKAMLQERSGKHKAAPTHAMLKIAPLKHRVAWTESAMQSVGKHEAAPAHTVLKIATLEHRVARAQAPLHISFHPCNLITSEIKSYTGATVNVGTTP